MHADSMNLLKVSLRRTSLMFDLVGALALDFDGVIADSMHLQEQIWQRAIAEQKGRISPDQKNALLRNFWTGKAGPQIFVGTGIRSEVEFDLRYAKDAMWEITRKSVPPVPGALDAIMRLYPVAPLAISTTAQREYVESSLKRFEIFECFTHIVTDDDVPNPKPAPDALSGICRLLSIEPGELLLIGDTVTDREMARAAGSIFVLLSRQPSTFRVEGEVTYTDWSSLAEDIIQGKNWIARA